MVTRKTVFLKEGFEGSSAIGDYRGHGNASSIQFPNRHEKFAQAADFSPPARMFFDSLASLSILHSASSLSPSV
jgi:hypothetical protein